MKAISLWQPWASAIASGLKTVETRSWRTGYRGPLAIHAALLHRGEPLRFWRRLLPQDRQAIAGKDSGQFAWAMLPFGAIVARCRLDGCFEINDGEDVIPYAAQVHWGDYRIGRFVWILKNITALPRPVAYRGRQGLFDVPDEIMY